MISIGVMDILISAIIRIIKAMKISIKTSGGGGLITNNRIKKLSIPRKLAENRATKVCLSEKFR
jgi:hypothetical protein